MKRKVISSNVRSIARQRRHIITQKRKRAATLSEIRDQLSRLEVEQAKALGHIQQLEEFNDDVNEIEPAQWKDAGGIVRYFSDMEEEYLRNIISYCARRLIKELPTSRFMTEQLWIIRGLADSIAEAQSRGLKV